MKRYLTSPFRNLLRAGVLFVFPIFVSLHGFVTAQEVETKIPKENNAPELVTRIYQIPATFFMTDLADYEGGGTPIDPFAVPGDPKKSKFPPRGIGPQEILESAGIRFRKGASAIYNAETGQMAVRNTEDQHELIVAYLDSISRESEKVLYVLMEYIEVEMEDFNRWLLSHHIDRDGQELRETVQEWIDGRDAKIIESSTVMARSGQRAKVESVREFIYPTEYDPPEIPSDVTLSGRAKSPVTGLTPTAYETRNIGHTLEIDPVLGADEIMIDLNLAPEIVTLAGYTSWPSAKIEPLFLAKMPTFYTMKITSQIMLQNGRYGFLGSTRPLKATGKRTDIPLVLQFVRVDVANIGGNWSVVEEEKKK